jgi:hypothetical protein
MISKNVLQGISAIPGNKLKAWIEILAHGKESVPF